MAKKSKSKKTGMKDSKTESPAIAAAPATDDSWKHEDDARTLQRAGEVMSDPERLKNAQKFLKKQKKAMRSVDDLISYRNSKFGPNSEEHDDDGDE